LVFIHPYDDIEVIAGQATIAKELLEQNPKMDRIFIPVGGGGLIAGMATYIKHYALNPAVASAPAGSAIERTSS
jgi:threonine dehydratase